jgi:hypothetical protein
VLEEFINLLPHLSPARQTTPICSKDPNQTIAVVNGGAIVLRRVGYAIDQQCLDIGGKLLQDGIPVNDRVPILQVKGRLHGAARARVSGNNSPTYAAVGEKGERDWNQETVPFLIVHPEIIEPVNVAGDTTEPLAGVVDKQNGAGITSAGDPVFFQLQKVLVYGYERRCAQFAKFHGLAWFAHELLQVGEGPSARMVA